MSVLLEPPPLPRLPQAGFNTQRAAPLAGGAGAIVAVLAAHLMAGGALPWPECRWLRWIGLPCPGCGGTRCLAACGRFDLATALSLNPLVALTACSLLGWCAVCLAAGWHGTSMSARVQATLSKVLTSRRVALLVVLNWLYLCWTLPR